MNHAQMRIFARRSALQALYQWQLTGYDLVEIERQFVEEHGLGHGDVAYFNELLHQIPQHVNTIDTALREFTDRSINDIDQVERAVLRIGAYELLFRPELPYRVILNECINLTKTYGATHGHKFVNSVLDRVAHKIRVVEIVAFEKDNSSRFR
ncbi:MAG: transcription antitermination factor NusB [Candidatus Methylumidiphilus sp.]